MLRAGEAVRWGVQSVGGLGANLVLLTVWVEFAGLGPEVALLVNWLLISVASYAVSDRWVFQDHESATGILGNVKRYLSMQGVMATGKAVNYMIYVALIYLGVAYQLAWVVGAAVTFLVTLSGNKAVWLRGVGT